MSGPPLPENESERLRALQRYDILDTPREAGFDRITRLAARLFDVPMALVSLIDANRQWWKSCIGVDGTETEREVAFCAYAILSAEPFIIEDATEDPRFCNNRFVTGEPYVRFYAGAPLADRNGYNLGTLCIIDKRARKLTRDEIATLVDLSRIVIDELELRQGYRSRAMFQKVCEVSPGLTYVYDRRKRESTFLGQHLFEALGYDGSPAPELLQSMVHPDDLGRVQEHRLAREALREGHIDLTYRIRDAQGEYRWYYARETVFEHSADGGMSQVIGITSDVTDLKMTEQRLARSEELLAERVAVLEGILESAGEGIVVTDQDSNFTVFNPAARRILGDSPRVGQKAAWPRPYAFVRPEGSQPWPFEELPLTRALRGEPSDNVEMAVRRENQPDTLIRVTGRPLLDAQGATCGGILTFNDITALRAAESEVVKLAVTDPLTGLANRRALDERLRLLVAEGCRGRRFALVLADIDHFKRVNDTYGHSTGDEVLTHVGKVLQSSVRCTDFVARYGGEEFCVLLTDVDEALAARLADNLRCAIAEQRCSVAVTASFGVCANRPNERTDPNALLRCADRALYAAKSHGRNRVVTAQLPARESIPIMAHAKARA